jgi:signal transduction histidine kinase
MALPLRGSTAHPARRRRGPSLQRGLERLAVQAICLAGLGGVLAAVYGAVVLGIGHVPSSKQTTLLGFSILAAAIAALLYQPVHTRLHAFATRLVRGERDSPVEVLRSFGTRLTQPIAIDELLLQLAEALRKTLALAGAEVWTGSSGLLQREASDPDRGLANLILSPAEQAVVARAGVSRAAWLSTWLPSLVAGREDAKLRAVPITHSGDLLGLIVVERAAEAEQFTAGDEQMLATLARQMGLALHNVRLGSELESSLEELQRQAEELRASRARVVAAADEERRRIERDLHDGAQQHLVSVAVNLRLARELAGSDPAGARAVLEELAGEVQDALREFRDLAHGIYPPVLVDRGLVEGLRAAVLRAPMRGRVEAAGIGRYSPELEATVYFCCLEALQNASKHAGDGARTTIRLWEAGCSLRFEVADDGVGFDLRLAASGTGLTNMSDRLGALGGRLSVRSSPGAGTRVLGTLPL